MQFIETKEWMIVFYIIICHMQCWKLGTTSKRIPNNCVPNNYHNFVLECRHLLHFGRILWYVYTLIS